MQIISNLAIFGAKYLYILVILLSLIYFSKLPRQKKKEMLLLGFISLPIIYIVAKIGNAFYFNPRPFVVDHFTPLIPHEPDNGFPSDHVLLISAISSVIFHFNRKLSLLLGILVLIVGFSRVYVGVHHAIDIIGSMVIAFTITIFIYQLIKRSKYYNSN